MKINKFLLLITVLSFAATLALYPSLPARIPTHWNLTGQIDAYGSRNMALLTAALPLAIYLLMVVIPLIDPKKDSYAKHTKAYTATQYAVVAVLIVIHWATLAITMGIRLSIPLVVSSLIGVMFLVMGNYMSQIRPNYFFGIRTPWTLADERVWAKTHRIGGYGFMVCGLLVILAGLTQNAVIFTLFMGYLFAYVIFIFAYSYFTFRKLNR